METFEEWWESNKEALTKQDNMTIKDVASSAFWAGSQRMLDFVEFKLDLDSDTVYGLGEDFADLD